jgi:hypothetical protein
MIGFEYCWWIIKGGIYVSKEKWKNYALLVHEWNVTLILLYYVFKLLIMLEITLCCNKDIIPPWCVRKSISRLINFERNCIFACYGWYEFCMNRRINRSISHPTPFVKTCNEKLKWNMDVYVWTCISYVVFFL